MDTNPRDEHSTVPVTISLDAERTVQLFGSPPHEFRRAQETQPADFEFYGVTALQQSVERAEWTTFTFNCDFTLIEKVTALAARRGSTVEREIALAIDDVQVPRFGSINLGNLLRIFALVPLLVLSPALLLMISPHVHAGPTNPWAYIMFSVSVLWAVVWMAGYAKMVLRPGGLEYWLQRKRLNQLLLNSVLSVGVVILTFGYAYWLLSHRWPDLFVRARLSRPDAIFSAFSIFGTIGTGMVKPAGWGEILIAIQIFLDLSLVVVVVGLLVSRAATAVQRRPGAGIDVQLEP